MPLLKRILINFLLLFCVIYPAYGAERDITLQWDKSIDDPYLQSYKVYYYTTSGNPESLDVADYAASYTLLGGDPVTIANPGPKPIIIDKSNTQITLHFLDNSKDYYFALSSIDTRGLEGIPTSEISLMKLTVTKAGTGTGTVTSTPAGIHTEINCGLTTCKADYNGGSQVILTATADAGNTFTGWSGGGCSGTGTCTVTITPGVEVTATFMPLRRLDVAKGGTGSGSISGAPLGISSDINCGSACSSDLADYIINTSVTLTATADAGNTFTGWSGGGCSGTGTCVVTMDMARSVTAMFMPLRALSIQKGGTGTGIVSGTPVGINSNLNCGSSCSASSADYIINTSVTLTATADAGNTFTGWSGGGCSGTGACVVTVDAAKTVTATFMPLRKLSVQKGGTGTGSVSGTPVGINSNLDCGSSCSTSSADYIINTTVTLTATADTGNTFTGWSGGGCSGTGTCVVTVDAAKTVTATFMPLRTLSVQKDGTGTGSIGGTPVGINSNLDCGSSCSTSSADYIINTTVTLTATADTGNTFTGWSGGGCSGTGTCVVTVDAAKTVTATFMPLRRLDVAKDGTGSGSISGTPLGIVSDINCGSACSSDLADYVINTTVTLTATADTGNTFTGWSGGGCSGTGTCVVTMDTARSVKATFMPLRTLSIQKAGTGTGIVSGTPVGISSNLNCGSGCSTGAADYIINTTVTLTATADTGNTFTGWSGGGCSGTGTCVVTVDAAKTVTATFMPLRTLTVQKDGTGTGSVSGTPVGINSNLDCGSSCSTSSADYIINSSVTLTATADAGNTFTGWSGGGCSGTGTCVVTMDTARSVKATFMPLRTLSIQKAGTGTGIVSGTPVGISSNLNCGSGCSTGAADYIINTTVTLTATADTGNTFTGWSGGGCSGTGTCVVTVDAAKTVTATFMPLRRLDVAKDGTGSGSISGTPLGIVSDINCGSACSSDLADYVINTTVTLTATADTGNTFTGWSGGGCSGTGTCVVTMDTARSVKATFMPLRTLSIQKAGTGTGIVSGTPVGISSNIDCGSGCSFGIADYIINTTVTVTATADTGNTFTGWSGGGCSGTGTCVVMVDAAKTVTATFMPLRTLTVQKDGTGTGSVSGTPVGINSNLDCGSSCSTSSADYIINSSVTLTATADAGNTFTGWSGGGCSGTGTCVVTVDAAKTVTATFMPLRALSIQKGGTGTGSVSGTPVGINSNLDCGSSCSTSSADYIIDTPVTLTAIADDGNVFTGWSGGGCSGTGACVVTMDVARAVTVTFMPLRRLDVAKGGLGSGSISGIPLGIGSDISCGSGCSSDLADFVINTSVTLTASADPNNIFMGWSGGGCSGTGTCVVTMDAAKTVTATFTPLRRLIVQKGGLGSGNISGTPVGISSNIDCGSGCSFGIADFIHNTVVTLTATPDEGSAFKEWSGSGCSGYGSCAVTMTTAKNVVAAFILKGDLNQDGLIDLADAILISRIILGDTTAVVEKSSSVAGNRKLGVMDLIFILQKAAGLR